MIEMEKIFLRPKKGSKVRVPYQSRYLNENGEWIRKSQYWLRRLKDGDVEKGPFEDLGLKNFKIEEL